MNLFIRLCDYRFGLGGCNGFEVEQMLFCLLDVFYYFISIFIFDC